MKNKIRHKSVHQKWRNRIFLLFRTFKRNSVCCWQVQLQEFAHPCSFDVTVA